MDRLLQLTQAYLDDSLKPEESHELTDLLATDPQALQQFCDTCILDSRLGQHLSTNALAADVEAILKEAALEESTKSESRNPKPALAPHPSDTIPSPDHLFTSSPLHPATPSSSHPASSIRHPVSSQSGFLQTALRSALKVRAHPFRLGGIALALTAIFWIGLISWLLPWRQGDEAAEQQPPSEEFVAHLTGEAGAVWDGDPPRSSHAGFFAGRELHLKNGLAEITFVSGARVILEGPANFTVGDAERPMRNAEQSTTPNSELRIPNSNNSAHLHLGKLTAHVPKQAIGFTVETSSATIIDLGTEFGIDASKTNVEVTVFQGAVSLTPKKASDQTVLAQAQTIKAGATATVGRGTKVVLKKPVGEPDQQKFSRELPPLVVNVDLGHHGVHCYQGQGAAPDLAENDFWNCFSRGQRSGGPLLASDGKTRTSIRFSENAQSSGDVSGLRGPAPPRIALFRDYHFGRRPDWTLKLSGLSSEAEYDLYLYASTVLNQGSDFTLGEETLSCEGTNMESFREGVNYVRFTGARPNEAGEIVVTIAAGKRTASIFNGFQIVELKNTETD